MISFLSSLTLLSPWVLAGLGVLPVLWYLLRITPPAPKVMTLPTMRFLMGLETQEQSPSHTPWWILLMRMIMAALVILALAQPVYNIAGTLPNTNKIRIVIDNGWESAQTWNLQIRAAQDILERADRENKELYILTTAPIAGNQTPLQKGPLGARSAKAIINGLSPLPWPSDYKATNNIATNEQALKNTHTYWFSSGLYGKDLDMLASTLDDQGELIFTVPAPEKLPLALKKPDHFGVNFQIDVLSSAQSPNTRSAIIQATTKNAQVIDQQTITLKDPGQAQTISFDIPEGLRNDVAQFKIAGQTGVGGLFLLDDQFQKKSVGLVNPAGEENIKPFIEARFYIQRALEPFADLKQGSIEELLKENLSVLILPDIASLPAETLDKLEDWVKEGGMLLRFAGPTMAESTAQNFLTPFPLRPGARDLEGSLSWQTPAKFSGFSETSPLYGIDVHENIAIKKQILASPSEDLEKHIWAALDDGTPLITAKSMDNGVLVMIHTSASPDWSDLPLSGVFVDILRRLVGLSGRSAASITTGGFLQPVWVYDGFARIKTPGSTVQPISAIEFDKKTPNPTNPPGLYGRGSVQKALNLGTHLKSLKAVSTLPGGIEVYQYKGEYEKELLPYLLYAALLLLLIDWCVMVTLAFGFSWVMRFAAITLVVTFPYQSLAQTSDETIAKALKYGDGLYLAYMKSGDTAVDQQTGKGLENLSAILTRRTSVEPAGVAKLDPETDDLTFFPLIYWAITDRPQPLSSKAINNIQNYLDHGGTILFDTRDQNQSSSRLRETANAVALRQMMGNLNVPPLAPIAEDHVLSRSFYLLDSYPGRFIGGTLWIETRSANSRDGVSSVIIGNHDWAGAWSDARTSRTGSVRPSTRDEEMAFRTGVNLIMYALTGNYKADQVHVPHILERLGQ